MGTSSTDMQRVEGVMNDLEREFYDRGFRYEKFVYVVDEDGSVFMFRDAFAVLYYDEETGRHEEDGGGDFPGEFFFVYTEHHGNHCYHLDDLWGHFVLKPEEAPEHPSYTIRAPAAELRRRRKWGETDEPEES